MKGFNLQPLHAISTDSTRGDVRKDWISFDFRNQDPKWYAVIVFLQKLAQVISIRHILTEIFHETMKSISCSWDNLFNCTRREQKQSKNNEHNTNRTDYNIRNIDIIGNIIQNWNHRVSRNPAVLYGLYKSYTISLALFFHTCKMEQALNWFVFLYRRD